MMMQQRLRSQLPQATMPGNKVVDPSRQVSIISLTLNQVVVHA